MPTGYTLPLYEGKDITFQQFVWRCARAFVALIMLRDDPMDAPIPERFEPDSYHVDRLAEHRERLAWLESLTASQAQEAADKAYAEALAYYEERCTEKDGIESRYAAMLEQVRSWEPPSSDHQGLKDLMEQQITESMRFDCYAPERPEPLTGPVWWAQEMAEAKRRIQYHIDERAKEMKRVEGRNEWLRKLRESVPVPAELVR